MAKQTRKIDITLEESGGVFSSIFSRIKGEKKSSGIIALRHLLSNEKARLLHVCKTKQPDSIYKLAKLLGRDFKAVRYDIRILEEFGLIELVSSNKNGRERLKPVVEADQLIISLNI